MTERRALVTGASGFVGRWLCSALIEEGWHVVGVASAPLDDAARADLARRSEWRAMAQVEWVYGDVRDATLLNDALDRARPDAIVPLAAISSVPVAAGDPAQAWDVNTLATVRLLHAVATRAASGMLDPTVLVIGSSEQYGRQDASVPLAEGTPQRPRTVYGASKAGQETAALQAHRATGVKTIAVRPFNHTGPGQEPRFLLPALVRRAIGLRAASADTPLVIGNSTPIRDFLHVKDAVAAYISLLRAGVPGTAYNVASGDGRSVRDVAEHVLAVVGVSAPIVEDPALVRAVDVPYLVGDATLLRQTTGWQTRYAFDDIVNDLLNDALLHATTH